jgi:hypothetical protein
MPDYGSFSAPTAGVTTTRSGALFGKVQFILGTADQSNLKRIINTVPPALIYEFLDKGQHRLATELLCIEKTTAALTVTSGVASEPTGFFRVKQIVLATSENYQPVEVSVQDYDMLTRSFLTSAQTPLYYKRWAGSITFFPTPSDGTYTMHYYGRPTTAIAQAVEPEVPAYMDDCLLYYAVKELAPVANRPDLIPTYNAYYAQEMERVMRSWRRTKTEAGVINYHDV